VKHFRIKGWPLLVAMAAMVPVAALTAMADTSTEQHVGKTITQDSSSDTESADVGQTFDVSGSGHNSDQCAGVQGATNTAPLEGGIDLLQNLSEAEDFSFEDVGGSDLNILQSDAEAGNFEFDGSGRPLTVGGANETTCEQKANQEEAARG
jgi:hypothetical protein